MSCRHCHPKPFERSYASVILLGQQDLRASVDELESKGIMPCLTAICPECSKLSVIYNADDIAPFVHTIALWKRLGPYLL